MTIKRYEGGFKEVKRVNVIPTRDGEELHFTKVEVGGKIRGDIRYFTEREGEMSPGRRGILIPENPKEFQESVEKLIKSLSEK
ncbi:MAG: hypothetical protein A3G33_08250 [Omnitrophica bacterium RIFCSPLOWO2_12_FULL_44_17]|uniref:Uncharacterized protein n=1 Tax=Candidatus Danuiimicrobium aquiferis TaxID=1801832 RepID=A0A1G1KWB4_9BACT|nr:MAG: hypothetical protein A3B72_03465 [Omnitrophica bacterium RIFCSPHIGHO2_02_FULL_45_28]OGW92613.1 MAG: hypothetical protein A3E74_02495 [Omnitrophica bacterium RIFCSPHIGHO2_12_FULL_44_12]OGW97155.1 MAG: hypothetical protein A3G33_08250 [Omnitrophica bacterium RIFCSPLOWO2_12_FULL_44_17]OGX02215.1 MAG: hypothetical protein A3J12_08025 [Omnitrophica bacterium RIFCSPLOWO2_02_FULL_44_11]